MKNAAAQNQKNPLPQLVNSALVGFFLITWLMPVLYYAAINRPAPWIPSCLHRWTNISRLFSSEQNFWAVYAIEYRKASSSTFEPLDESLLFQMEPFGKRTRLQRILSMANEKERKELCLWIKNRVQASDNERITSVRIVVFPNTARRQIPDGGYSQPTIAEIDPLAIREVERVDFTF